MIYVLFLKKLNTNYENATTYNEDKYEESYKDNHVDTVDNSINDMTNKFRLSSNAQKKNINLVFQEILKKFFPKDLELCKNNNNNHGKDRLFVIGLGSGSTVSSLVEEFSSLQEKDKERLGFIPTSYQIKIIGEQSGLTFLDESKIIDIDLVVDGADQIDDKLNMIKGGGGALFKEKVLMQSAKEKIILADSHKYVSSFTIPVPVEVHPFARSAVSKKIETLGGKPNIRFLKKGYPIITENGNIILDIQFDQFKPEEISTLEKKIKNISGVIEVGIFSVTRNTSYYSLKNDGTYSMRKC